MTGLQFKVDTRIQGQFLKNPEQTLPVYEKEFRAGLTDATMLVQREVVTRTPSQKGDLRRSISSDVKGAGLNMHGVVGTPMVYALPVEMGAGPHFPPVDRIGLWVRRVNMSIEYLGRPLAIAQMAFLVARSISQRGLSPHWMFRDGLSAARSRVLSTLQNAQDRILKALEK